MRLFKTHSHTSEGQGYKADRGHPEKREVKEGLAVRGRNALPTKAFAIPSARGAGRESLYGKAKGWHKMRGGPVLHE